MDEASLDWTLFRPEPPLCTLIRFSDPHFGSSFVTRDEQWWRKGLPHLPVVNLLTGLFPHSYTYACALAAAFHQIVQHRQSRKVPVTVVHSGDLTSSGKQAEFSTGATFLAHGHYSDTNRLHGLGLDKYGLSGSLLDIPGNHDLWSRGDPKQALSFSTRYGGPYPRRLDTSAVVIYGMDSNRAPNAQHRRANGEIPMDQLGALLGMMRDDRKAGRVVIVTLHHPVQMTAESAPKLAGKEILFLKDRDKIARSLRENGACVVLAGHVHQPQWTRATPGSPLQYVAGSACQSGAKPQFWILDLYPDEVIHHSMVYPPNAVSFFPDPDTQGRASFEVSP
ncbi:MAG: metallophosphoesterase [Bryobacteraceae bacterium]